jgi:hypothetical protein
MDGYLSLEIIIYKHLSIASNLLVYPKYNFTWSRSLSSDISLFIALEHCYLRFFHCNFHNKQLECGSARLLVHSCTYGWFILLLFFTKKVGLYMFFCNMRFGVCMNNNSTYVSFSIWHVLHCTLSFFKNAVEWHCKLVRYILSFWNNHHLFLNMWIKICVCRTYTLLVWSNTDEFRIF